MEIGGFSFDALDDLYRETILDHYRHPRNHVQLEAPDITAEGFNPFCGDGVVLGLKLDGEDRVAQVGFQGQGCSISQASASMLTQALQGKTLKEAEELSGLFRSMMEGHEASGEAGEALGDLAALRGVRQFPVRIKCALLAWAALEEGIENYPARLKKA